MYGNAEIPEMSHHCHAYDCHTPVDPKLLMCRKHWRMVPRKLQLLVWSTYRPGQEIDKEPTEAYLLVQRAAVWTVFVKESGCDWDVVPPVGSTEYMIGPEVLAR